MSERTFTTQQEAQLFKTEVSLAGFAAYILKLNGNRYIVRYWPPRGRLTKWGYAPHVGYQQSSY